MTAAASVPRLAVQRMIVRLLHDPSLLQADWSAEGLDAEEERWLRGQDPRAWRTDPYRVGRLLAGLVEEYPAATGAFSGDLRAFVRSAAFHGCVRDGGSLASSFGAWLSEHGSDEVRAMARVEAAVAACRRSSPTLPAPYDASTGPRLVRSPRCAVVRGSVGPPYGIGEVALVELDAAGGASVAEIPEALAALLEAADRPTPRAALLDRARALGAEGEEAAEVVEGLRADGLLVDA
jgi:hypothetical protein